MDRAVEFLNSKGVEIDARPTTKITEEVHQILSDEFQTDASKRVKSQELSEAKFKEKEALRIEREKEIEEKISKVEAQKSIVKAKTTLSGPKKVGKIDLDKPKKEVSKPKEAPKQEEKKPVKKKKVEEEIKLKTPPKKEVEEIKIEDVKVETQYKKLSGPKLSGEKIDLAKFNKPKKKKEEKKPAKKEVVSKTSKDDSSKRKRRRISKAGESKFQNRNQRHGGNRFSKGKKPAVVKEEPSEEEVQKQIRETLEKLQGKSSKGKGAKYRREKRDQHKEQTEIDQQVEAAESKILKVTEFVTANEVATMMNVSVTEIISACMSLWMMVTMNQRLDAETLSIVAEEFGYKMEFVTADIEEAIEEV